MWSKRRKLTTQLEFYFSTSSKFWIIFNLDCTKLGLLVHIVLYYINQMSVGTFILLIFVYIPFSVKKLSEIQQILSLILISNICLKQNRDILYLLFETKLIYSLYKELAASLCARNEKKNKYILSQPHTNGNYTS